MNLFEDEETFDSPYDQPMIITNDGVVINSPEIIEKIKKKKLSPSMITGLEGCHAAWVAKTFVIPEIIEEQPDNAARRGSAFHKIMEDLFALPAEERTEAKLKELTNNVLSEGEFSDLAKYPEALEWMRTIVTNYIDMGAKPQNVSIAKFEDRGKIRDGIELFVSGNFGNTDRDILGFVDLIIGHPKKENQIVVQDWKGLALDTPLPTMTGWTTMGEVAVGDRVIGSNGKETTVLEKSSVHNRPCYKITFYDGSEIVADNVHLWDVRLGYTKKGRAKNVVINTEELFKKWENSPKYHIQIKNPAPIQFPSKTLSIDPYILGSWIGDGLSKCGTICVGKKDFEETKRVLSEHWDGELLCREESSSMMITLSHNNSECPMSDSECKDKTCSKCQKARNLSGGIRGNASNAPLSQLLDRLSLKKNKHIPLDYLRSSIDQRISLIQGLMDTDGYWHPKRRRALFYTTEKHIAESVQEIIVSLGITPTTNRGENNHKGYYEIGFCPIGFNPFKLPRKARLVEEHLNDNKRRTHKALHRVIKNISKVDSVPTQCIKVDAEDSLYLCGRLMTPTHNTGKVHRWNPNTKSDVGLGEARQQTIYSMLLEKMGYEVAGARLVYPYFQEIVNVDIHDKDWRDRVINDIALTEEKLNHNVEHNLFEYSPGVLCAWCPLAKICPETKIVSRNQKFTDAYDSQPDIDILSKGFIVE